MPRFGPDGIFPPEIIEVLERAMEKGVGNGVDLNQVLAEAMERYNHTPQPGLDGLSPDQVVALLSSDWLTPGHGVSINQELTLAELEHIPLFRTARAFLALVRDEGPLGTTSRGHLDRKVVARVMDRLDLEPDIMRFGGTPPKVINEDACGQLRMLREAMENATLIRDRRGFEITRAGLDALRPERAGVLFANLFCEVAGDPKSVMDVCDDVELILARLPVAVWRLSRHATRWTDGEDLAWVCWPMTPEEAPRARSHAVGGSQQFNLGTFMFLLFPLTELGLLEQRESMPGAPDWKVEYRTTPLFERFFEFHV
jgi:hypothetical protein